MTDLTDQDNRIERRIIDQEQDNRIGNRITDQKQDNRIGNRLLIRNRKIRSVMVQISRV